MKFEVSNKTDIETFITNVNRKTDINKFADIIKEEIDHNYEHSLNYDGSSMLALKQATILQKSKLGSGTADKPLIRSGQLEHATKKEVLNENEIDIVVQDKVRDKATNISILKFQTKFNRIPFGITMRALQKIRDMLNGR